MQKTLKVLNIPQILRGKRIASRKDLVLSVVNALANSSLVYQDEWMDLAAKEVAQATKDWEEFCEWVEVPVDHDPPYNLNFDTGAITYEVPDDVSDHSKPGDADDAEAPAGLQQHGEPA